MFFDRVKIMRKEKQTALKTRSGILLKDIYRAADLPNPETLSETLGEPGEYPFSRGVQKDMYRGRLWTMRQYAGFGTAEE
ncbi:MAG TPA: methylmalonyl-CoA mutase, partial [Bdellovibrionales bacterium]|nr:methylmalonyl-CoA mutase [Bdellovibrionales bacterium]